MKKILVIEDEKLIRENLRVILECDGYLCDDAENGEIGLSKIRSFKPDLVLCDLMLPKLDGFSILREIRKDPEFIDLPLIFLTARADEKDKRAGMNLGADDYITKPFSKKSLTETIAKRLALAHNRIKQRDFVAQTNGYNIFYTVSSHEYLTPLNTIINLSQIIRNENVGVLPKDTAQLLTYIEYSGKKLYRVTRKLFWYIKIIDKKEPPWQQNGNDNICIRRFFENLRDYIMALGYNSNIQMECGDHCIANYNLGDVELMLAEIFENAVKFALPFTAINIFVSQQSKFTVIIIENTYVGKSLSTNDISPLKTSDSNGKWTGPGLGLFLLQCWVNSMGGFLEVKGNGSDFMVKVYLQTTM